MDTHCRGMTPALPNKLCSQCSGHHNAIEQKGGGGGDQGIPGEVGFPSVRFEPDCPVLGRLVRLKISAGTRHRYTHVYPQFFAPECSLEIGRVSGFSTYQPGNPMEKRFGVRNKDSWIRVQL